MHSPTVLLTLAVLAISQATAASIPRQDSGFGDFASGRGSALFGNAGTPCSVGREDGECDQFGRMLNKSLIERHAKLLAYKKVELSQSIAQVLVGAELVEKFGS
ncbi:hypothetical protein B0T10DRAFT_464524 [Thelonectria olida]|uniref:Uncharacterized protein n=1 Tax=Thelonectria olida TaxID=1576542 RepID=A0A9P9AJQ0_9HYPO|nr:hypothetical protein B0T10DRAFT_464524 [Thelonectria olida]